MLFYGDLVAVLTTAAMRVEQFAVSVHSFRNPGSFTEIIDVLRDHVEFGKRGPLRDSAMTGVCFDSLQLVAGLLIPGPHQPGVVNP
uniref:Uncharacterized protein n=1 Tax=Mycolicibacter arupensis TaxID=342002 RepID=A0A0F5MXW9_9MYCO